MPACGMGLHWGRCKEKEARLSGNQLCSTVGRDPPRKYPEILAGWVGDHRLSDA